MNIHQLMKSVDDIYYSKEFMQAIEDHLTYLRTVATVTTISVTQFQNNKYEGDFYGLLDNVGVEKKYHYAVLRVNGYVNATDFKGDLEYFVMPDLSEIEEIKMLINSAQV